jgi:hypothetical protein
LTLRFKVMSLMDEKQYDKKMAEDMLGRLQTQISDCKAEYSSLCEFVTCVSKGLDQDLAQVKASIVEFQHRMIKKIEEVSCLC